VSPETHARQIDEADAARAAADKRARLALDRAFDAASEEVVRALDKFGPNYASAHHALGVLEQEVDEFRQWVYRQRGERDKRAMCEELAQIACVALKYHGQLLRELDEHAAKAAGGAT
jgi:NTP pyrophosphatase (non-canonical NTP hydrolase)